MMHAEYLVNSVLRFLKTTELHSDVVKQLHRKAVQLRTKTDVEDWLALTKKKMGIKEYKRMKLSHSHSLKKDVGFESLEPDDLCHLFGNYYRIDLAPPR
ncbi:unknown [Feldmannia species virus]|uniref:Uncharacterized protein n=1 Tax=Feldmannia species virus TaxID=39420 RepID=B5LWI7_9PHYC|nr:hypothetical protein FeldSpV_gp098 [Feldmannia species virus]ACH46850.1 unknown [Feldmannia species virus]